MSQFVETMLALADARIPVAWVRPGQELPPNTVVLRDYDGFWVEANGVDRRAIVGALRSHRLDVVVR